MDYPLSITKIVNITLLTSPTETKEGLKFKKGWGPMVFIFHLPILLAYVRWLRCVRYLDTHMGVYIHTYV